MSAQTCTVLLLLFPVVVVLQPLLHIRLLLERCWWGYLGRNGVEGKGGGEERGWEVGWAGDSAGTGACMCCCSTCSGKGGGEGAVRRGRVGL